MTNLYFVCGEHEEPRCCTIILDIQRSALLYRKWIFTLRLMKHEFSRLHLNYSPILICNKKLMILAAFPPPDIYILCWFMNDDVFYSAQSCVRWFISQTGFTAGFQLWRCEAQMPLIVQMYRQRDLLFIYALLCWLVHVLTAPNGFDYVLPSTSHIRFTKAPSRQTHVILPLSFRCLRLLLYCSTAATSKIKYHDKKSMHFRLKIEASD